MKTTERMLKKGKKIRNKALYLFLLPSAAYLIIFCYAPLYGLQIAFKDYNSFLGINASPWVDFKHFAAFISAPNFWSLLTNTLVLSLYSLAMFPLPVFLALLINEVRKGWFKRTVQTISYAPFFVSVVVVVGIMFGVLNSENGVVNRLLEAIGLQRVAFMTSSDWFPSLYVISMVWQTLGWSAIIYVGTLSNVDPELHEAAVIDGAGRLRRIWHINLPVIMPLMAILFILNVGQLMSIGFEKVYLMQTPGNLEKSEIIATYVYRITLLSKLPQYSFGTAVGLFNSVVNIILLILANTFSKRLGQESLW